MTNTRRYKITDLGILPGFESTQAVAINDQCQIIGRLHTKTMDLTPHSFLWMDGVMQEAGKVWLNAINNKGQAVGYQLKERNVPFLGIAMSAVLHQNNSNSRLFQSDKPISSAASINDLGQVVGDVYTFKQGEQPKHNAFLWEKGQSRHLALPPGFTSATATSINNHGQIVGKVGVTPPPGRLLPLKQAVLWNGDEITPLRTLPDYDESRAVAINNRGQVLCEAQRSHIEEVLGSYFSEHFPNTGGRIDKPQAERDRQIETDQREMRKLFSEFEQQHPQEKIFKSRAFLWEDGKIQPLPTWQLPEQHDVVIANDLNDKCEIVGKAPIAEGQMRAVFWINGEALSLSDHIPEDSDWLLTEATGINNHGQIVGNGELKGERRAFLLNLL